VSSGSVELYEQHRARDGFRRNMDRLRLGLALNDARRHIEPLIELCEMYLAGCGDTQLAADFREQLERSKCLVEVRHVLLNKEPANDAHY
jgi:hypothetical protein